MRLQNKQTDGNRAHMVYKEYYKYKKKKLKDKLHLQAVKITTKFLHLNGSITITQTDVNTYLYWIHFKGVGFQT